MIEPKNFIEKEYLNILDDLKSIALIASPPFNEKGRIGFIRSYLSKKGLQDTQIDKEGNLSLELKGDSDDTILFSAHVDTAFPEATKLEIKEDNERIYCPGICDNSMGIVSLLYLIAYIKKNNIKLKNRNIFLFNVGEEELGNLRGIKYFIDNLKKDDLRAHIVIEGHKIGRLTTKAVGSHRVNIKIKTDGGHSWRDYGKPNAIMFAARIIQGISSLEFCDSPKTTFNIGIIKGGKSVSSIPDYCEFSLEIRSTSQEKIKGKKRHIDSILSNLKEVQISTEILGDRPAGEMNNKELIGLIRQVHNKLHIETIDDIGSTDSNYPISLGLPSLTIGITDAEKTHSVNEFLYKEPIKKGIIQLFHIFNELNK